MPLGVANELCKLVANQANSLAEISGMAKLAGMAALVELIGLAGDLGWAD